MARLYGDRPEIFGNVSWHALTELASSATSEAARQKFEARILAGERVNGAEIIRARAATGARTARTVLSLWTTTGRTALPALGTMSRPAEAQGAAAPWQKRINCGRSNRSSHLEQSPRCLVVDAWDKLTMEETS